MKPIIGLNLSVDSSAQRFESPAAYSEAIAAAGGIPVLLPPLEGRADIRRALDACDGLMLTGGDDYDPGLYGQAQDPKTKRMDPRRDSFDMELVKAAFTKKMPVLGICNGCQLINIAMGGTLHQDIFSSSAFPDPLRHQSPSKRMVHWVEVQRGSRLADITRAPMLHTNSSHHQSVDQVGKGLYVTARSSDGCVEAIESRKKDPFLVGVQWHPEKIIENAPHLKLFRTLVGEARSASKRVKVQA